MAEPTAKKNVTATARFRLPLHWLGVAPFFLFALMFLVLPTMNLVVGAFQNPDGAFTLDNFRELNTPSIIGAYWISIKVSLASSILGAVIGFAMAVAIIRGGLPEWIRDSTLTLLALMNAGVYSCSF